MSVSDVVSVPASARFPVELEPPRGFEPDDRATWPQVTGRLEWVRGRLWFMPPTGDAQQYTVADVVGVLSRWAEVHPDYLVGTNEAGIHLGEDVRAADAVLWHRSDVGPVTGGIQEGVVPRLVVEVAGRFDSNETLTEKASWYVDNGVPVVWLVFPGTREVAVCTAESTTRHSGSNVLREHESLPGLAPAADELFRQLIRLDAASSP